MREITDLEITDVDLYQTDTRKVLIISWAANIGWGEYTFYYEDGEWCADSECMDSNDDKKFAKMLFDKFVEGCKIL